MATGLTLVLAFWGAALSTVLGLIQLGDRRVKVDLGWDFRPAGLGGKTIEINNLSNRPVLIQHWELFTLTGFLRRNGRQIESSFDTTGSLRIEAYDRHVLTFDEGEYFMVKDRERLYLRIRVAGTIRRSIRRRIPA